MIDQQKFPQFNTNNHTALIKFSEKSTRNLDNIVREIKLNSREFIFLRRHATKKINTEKVLKKMKHLVGEIFQYCMTKKIETSKQFQTLLQEKKSLSIPELKTNLKQLKTDIFKFCHHVDEKTFHVYADPRIFFSWLNEKNIPENEKFELTTCLYNTGQRFLIRYAKTSENFKYE